MATIGSDYKYCLVKASRTTVRFLVAGDYCDLCIALSFLDPSQDSFDDIDVAMVKLLFIGSCDAQTSQQTLTDLNKDV